jgi:hypothetical protein
VNDVSLRMRIGAQIEEAILAYEPELTKEELHEQ